MEGRKEQGVSIVPMEGWADGGVNSRVQRQEDSVGSGTCRFILLARKNSYKILNQE